MKRFFQTTLFIVVLSVTAIYSKTISKEMIRSYNNCVCFMANNTVGTTTVLSF